MHLVIHRHQVRRLESSAVQYVLDRGQLDAVAVGGVDQASELHQRRPDHLLEPRSSGLTYLRCSSAVHDADVRTGHRVSATAIAVLAVRRALLAPTNGHWYDRS